MAKNKNRSISEWFQLKPVLGNANWALFYCLLGGREVAKSYAVMDYFVSSFVNKGIPFTWLRLTETAMRKLLCNNALDFIDKDIRDRYGLDLQVIGNVIYSVKRQEKQVKKKDGTIEIKKEIVEKKIMARVYALSTFYNDKGSLFDANFLKDMKMQYHIAVDEFEREKGEKNTFNIVYALVNQLENMVRSTKERIKIFLMGNTLEEASDILCAFNFIPEKWGVFKLKSKRCVIYNIEPSEKYLARRKGTVADLILPKASTFTNKINTDTALVDKRPLVRANYIIKFGKETEEWYTVWNNNIVCKYNGEKVKSVIAMKPFIDEFYSVDNMKQIINCFDVRGYRFRNLVTFKQFQNELMFIRPAKK